ncbi:hypothetical protein [Arthrobacter agilis]|uniref:hypothetical protein n=1 Tax=Arthrobacter agilis TaxID=37921 RepID=UPI0027821B64|nr:hypothetical protein [Arthrobacter agilis]MDQ0733565.1 hypothetical protein [Arthrobacter agilis]
MNAVGDPVSRPADRTLVMLRSAGVGLLSVGLGLGAHALSGGPLPSVPILCGLAALAVLAATLVAQARLPGWAVLLLLGVAQQVLHWLLGGLGTGTSSTIPSSGVHHGGEVPVGAGPAQGHSPEVMLMLHTHLAAALLIAWAAAQYPRLRAWLTDRDPGRDPVRAGGMQKGAPVG